MFTEYAIITHDGRKILCSIEFETEIMIAGRGELPMKND